MCGNGAQRRWVEGGGRKGGLLGTRPSMQKITQQSVVKNNLHIGEAIQNTHRERERGREAQRVSLLKNATVTKTTNNLYKRLQGHFI